MHEQAAVQAERVRLLADTCLQHPELATRWYFKLVWDISRTPPLVYCPVYKVATEQEYQTLSFAPCPMYIIFTSNIYLYNLHLRMFCDVSAITCRAFIDLKRAFDRANNDAIMEEFLHKGV